MLLYTYKECLTYPENSLLTPLSGHDQYGTNNRKTKWIKFVSDTEPRRNEIAKRYGSVLFDLAQENKDLKTILKDVNRLQQCLQAEPREWAQVISPSLLPKTQRHVIESLATSLKLGSLMKRFLNILCQNRRLQNLNPILEEFLAQTQAAEGIVKGVLETAAELSKKEIETLQKSLELQVKKKVSLRQEIKPSLLGGVVLRIGSLMIDASIGTQLNKLRQVMEG